MFGQHSDTPPEVTAILMDLLRKASPARKLELVGQMNLTVNLILGPELA